MRTYLLRIANRGIRGRLRAKFDAADIVQISFLDAHAGIVDFNGTTEAELRAWLKKIVLNNLIAERRRYTNTQARNLDRECSLEGVLSSLSHKRASRFHDATMWQNEVDRLELAVNRLPPRQQYVVKARQQNDLSYRQIARRLNTTEGASRNLWSRAVKQLRTRLETES